MNIQQAKQRFGIIGNTIKLNRAIETALQIAPTDLSVLITGESGVGKEVFSQIIHQNSSRKHNQYIAINCGAIPDGTIDSELFGHEKGAFTGAVDSRKGYFEVVNGGTIFLDEIGELPLSSQVRLLRILEAGEYIKVGSSKTQKTNVRVVAATNVNLLQAIEAGKFREDLYYRLNTVPISIPPLRERPEDIPLLFKKFANDSAEKYGIPTIKIDQSAQQMLISYYWPGNIRQLKNIAEQISILEKERDITASIIQSYLPANQSSQLPTVIGNTEGSANYASEREILFKLLFDMKKDMNDLKKYVHDMRQNPEHVSRVSTDFSQPIHNIFSADDEYVDTVPYQFEQPKSFTKQSHVEHTIEDTEEIIEETLSLSTNEQDFIRRALQKYNGKRKLAAKELGISERTLYRKIKEYNM